MAVINQTSIVLDDDDTDLGANSPLIGWHNLVDTTTIAAGSSQTNYPVSNLANPSTAEKWKSDSLSDQYVTVDTGSADREIDYAGIARHNLGSTGATVSLEVLAPGDSDYTEVISGFIPADNAPILLRFTPQYCDYVRIKISPASVKPEMAVVYVGALLVMQRGIQEGHTPLPLARQDDVVRGTAQNGDFLGSIVLRESLQTSVNFQYLDSDWIRENMLDFFDAARTTPFFFAWQPEAYPTEVGYAWTTNDPRPSEVVMDYAHLSLDLRAIAK